MMKEMTMAGPAPGRNASPTIAVPVVANIPAPIVAPPESGRQQKIAVLAREWETRASG